MPIPMAAARRHSNVLATSELGVLNEIFVIENGQIANRPPYSMCAAIAPKVAISMER